MGRPSPLLQKMFAGSCRLVSLMSMRTCFFSCALTCGMLHAFLRISFLLFNVNAHMLFRLRIDMQHSARVFAVFVPFVQCQCARAFSLAVNYFDFFLFFSFSTQDGDSTRKIHFPRKWMPFAPCILCLEISQQMLTCGLGAESRKLHRLRQDHVVGVMRERYVQ